MPTVTCVCNLLAICPRWGKLLAICPRKINIIYCVCKFLAICPRKNNIIYLRGQIANNLHRQKILFILGVHIISYLPQVGQIISYLPMQNKYYFLRVQIIIYLPTQINNRLKLFAHGNLRVQVISYLPQVGQIISYLPTQNKYYFLRVQIIIYLSLIHI